MKKLREQLVHDLLLKLLDRLTFKAASATWSSRFSAARPFSPVKPSRRRHPARACRGHGTTVPGRQNPQRALTPTRAGKARAAKNPRGRPGNRGAVNTPNIVGSRTRLDTGSTFRLTRRNEI